MKRSMLHPDPYFLYEQEKRFKEEFKELSDSDLENLLYFVRKIMLLKLITQQDTLKSNRFLQGIIYDALFALKEIKSNERYFYFNIRSLIENLMRFVIKLENDSSMGVTKLEREFSKYSLFHQQRLVSIYGEACNFVHNNQLSGLDLEVNYQEIKSSVRLDSQKQQGCIIVLKAIADAIAESLIRYFLDHTVNIFPMNIKDLHHLLGEEYSEHLKKILDQ